MAIQIPNFYEAAGIFDGRLSAPDNPIVSAEGFLPIDAEATPSHPRGGFTRVATGVYVLGLERKIDALESVLLARFVAGSAAAPGPQIATAPTPFDGFMTVADQSAPEVPFNYVFYFTVLRIKTGPNATSSSEP